MVAKFKQGLVAVASLSATALAALRYKARSEGEGAAPEAESGPAWSLGVSGRMWAGDPAPG